MELILDLLIFYETLEGGEWRKVPKTCKQGIGKESWRECLSWCSCEDVTSALTTDSHVMKNKWQRSWAIGQGHSLCATEQYDVMGLDFNSPNSDVRHMEVEETEKRMENFDFMKDMKLKLKILRTS